METNAHMCAKVAYCVFVWNGVLYIRTVPDIMLSIIVMSAMLYCYYVSYKLCGVCEGWVKYHVAFHLFAIQGQIMVINRIINNVKNAKKFIASDDFDPPTFWM